MSGNTIVSREFQRIAKHSIVCFELDWNIITWRPSVYSVEILEL